MRKVVLLLVALLLGGMFASSTYEDASARGCKCVVKKKKRVYNRAEWIRTPAIVVRTWSWGWWTYEPTYYGTPIWTLAKYGHRGVYVSSARRRVKCRC